MRLRSIAFGLAALLAAASPALAGHGKAGLWEITTTTSAPAMTAQLPPEILARMRARGVNMAGNTITARHCMTAQEVAMTKPPVMPKRAGQDCKMQNLKTSGDSVSADMVCTGSGMNGTGHFTTRYDSPEHYSGRMSMNMTAHGHSMAMSNSFEGKWISASCGGVTH